MVKIDNVENAILLNDEIHYDLIKKSMMFLMKEILIHYGKMKIIKMVVVFHLKYLIKISNRFGKSIFHLIGRTITKIKYYKNINGITLSPKKNFVF